MNSVMARVECPMVSTIFAVRAIVGVSLLRTFSLVREMLHNEYPHNPRMQWSN
jgi:hypothetical protein